MTNAGNSFRLSRRELIAAVPAIVVSAPAAAMSDASRRMSDIDSYHRWLEVTLPPTMAALPVLAIPAGFGGNNHLPIGIQLITPRNADLAVLQLGHA